jgi:wyosine [tRNA(Phe)-imidazoG37] synthetase (radical SAM superfamily)
MENTTMYEDIMQGLQEIQEYQKGNIQLRTSSVIVLDDNDPSYRLYKKITRLSEPNRQKVATYVDGLDRKSVV